jgi:heme exporter protein A
MSATLISVRGLCLERGGRSLVENFALEVGPGELVLIEGANGAGKTTLLRSLAGLSQLGMEGEIRRHCVQLLYLGHRPGIKQLLTARENLAWYCQAYGLDDNRVESALDRVGLYGYEDMLCQNMSAGQQRRVNLARLYLGDGGLWLLDEPFTAIDKAGVKSLSQTLVEQVESGGAVIMTSHQELPIDYPLRRVKLGVSS